MLLTLFAKTQGSNGAQQLRARSELRGRPPPTLEHCGIQTVAPLECSLLGGQVLCA